MSHLWKKKRLWENVMDFIVFMKRKEFFFREQWWFRLMVKRLVQSGKLFITMILNFNAFTTNVWKKLLNVWRRLRKQEKRTSSLVHPSIYSPPGPLPPCVPQPLSCGLENIISFMSVCAPQPLPSLLNNRFYLWVPVYLHILKISISHGIFDVQWNFWCPLESFTSWIFQVSKYSQYYTIRTVTIVTQFPYIFRFYWFSLLYDKKVLVHISDSGIWLLLSP